MKNGILIITAGMFMLLSIPAWSRGAGEQKIPKGKTIFEIGTEDNSYGEFKLTGFRDMEVFIWDCSRPCDNADFPYSLWKSGHVSDKGVNEVVVKFSLDKDYYACLMHLSLMNGVSVEIESLGNTLFFIKNKQIRKHAGGNLAIQQFPG